MGVFTPRTHTHIHTYTETSAFALATTQRRGVRVRRRSMEYTHTNTQTNHASSRRWSTRVVIEILERVLYVYVFCYWHDSPWKNLYAYSAVCCCCCCCSWLLVLLLLLVCLWWHTAQLSVALFPFRSSTSRSSCCVLLVKSRMAFVVGTRTAVVCSSCTSVLDVLRVLVQLTAVYVV